VLPVGGPTLPRTPRPSGRDGAAPGDLPEIYRLEERTGHAQVRPGSSLAGSSLADSRLREQLGLTVTGVQRGRALYTSPPASFKLREGDVVELMGQVDDNDRPAFQALFRPVPVGQEPRQPHPTPGNDSVMAEAVLPPRSALYDRTLKDVRFADRFGLTVLALWRGDNPIRTDVGDVPLSLGDALLVQGPPDMVERARQHEELIILGGAELGPEPTRGRRRTAVFILAVAILLGALRPDAMGPIFVIGALIMVLLNILTMDRAHHAIDWRTIFLVAGMLPLGLALQRTGAATLLADQLVSVLGPLGPMALLAGVFLAAALLTQAVVGPAVAAMMGPVAIQVAVQVGLDPRAMAMAVALACSMAFLTPLGHPVNVLVMGPGGYRFADYRRVGLPMAIVLVLVILAVLPVVFPLG
jgi:di/tricarboxylate transporter